MKSIHLLIPSLLLILTSFSSSSSFIQYSSGLEFLAEPNDESTFSSKSLRGDLDLPSDDQETNDDRDLKHKKNHKKKHKKKKTKHPTTGEEQIPTNSPTNKPTKFGETYKPTKAPKTSKPTDQPTAYPTDKPTNNPSFKPTKSPSKDPTEKPTTLFPTKSPTNFPTTRSPTLSPQTRAPTLKPTTVPTLSPTMSPTEQRPNIIIVIGDDIGYYDLGAHGNPYVQTPYINQLRESSMRFEDFHMNPTCSPSRAGLLTGRFATRGGVWHTISGRSILYESEITMPQVFKQHGWSTALIGKWHLGDNYPFRPQDRGFDFTYTLRGGGVAQSPDYWANSNFNTVFYRNGIPEKTTGFCTDTLFNEAINFVSKAQQPFFLMMPTNAAHAPQNAPPEDEALYKAIPKAAQFYGMITNLDRNIGRLDTALEKLGLKQNTIFIVTSDNGSACGPDRCTFNGGDTGFKSSLFEGGHRVFMFFRWPKKGLVSNVVNQLTANIDIMPTLLDLSLINYVPADTNKFDGVSLAPLLFKIRDGKNLQTTPGKETKSPTSNIEEVLTNRIMIIEDQRVKIPEKYKNTVITKNTWRYIPPKLYNLAKDPKQTNDVSRGNPDIVKELDDYYSKFWDEMATVRSQCASFILGEEENPANFNPMDWFVSPPPPWSQDMIINEFGFQEGAWNVKVRKPGMFRITARKYPEESLKAINSGKSQFRAAHFTAPNGVTKKVPIAGRLREVVFDDVYLEAGEFKLSVQFIPTEPSGLAMNAYYVTVAKYPLPTKNPTFKPTHLPTTARPTAPTQADQNYNITTYSPTSSSNITHRLG